MDLTSGNPDAFAHRTVTEVLEKARSAIRAETENKLRSEQSLRVRAESNLAQARGRSEAILQAQRDRIQVLAASAGRWAARAALVLEILLLVVGAYSSSPHRAVNLPDDLDRLLTPVVLVAVAVLMIANLAFGTTLKSLVRQLEISLSRRIESVITRMIGP